MNITPWPMNTLSSMVTPSQTKVWLEILQRRPTDGILLNFDERADFRFVADFAAVQVDELGKLHVLAELYVRGNAAVFVHRRTNSPLFLMDCSAASSMRTTRRPAWPSLKGVLFWRMQSAK